MLESSIQDNLRIVFYSIYLKKKERERICKTFFITAMRLLLSQIVFQENIMSYSIKKPKVFMSVPVYQDLKVRRTNDKQIKIVHHGVANKIEK